MTSIFTRVLSSKEKFAVPYFRDDSLGTHYRWLKPDDQESFNKNQKDGLVNGLGPDDVTYKHNKQGFRSDEFSNSPCVLSFGCSITKGVGVPYVSTFPCLVANALQLMNFNLAIGASNNDYMFLQFSHSFESFNPKLVLMNWTFPNRTYFVTNKTLTFASTTFSGTVGEGKNTQQMNATPYYEVLGESVWYTHVSRLLSYVKSVDMLCRSKKITVVHNFIGFEDITQVDFIKKHIHNSSPVLFGNEHILDKKGRDRWHPGIEWHRIQSQRILKVLEH